MYLLLQQLPDNKCVAYCDFFAQVEKNALLKWVSLTDAVPGALPTDVTFVRYPFFWVMPTLVETRLSGVGSLDKSQQRHALKDSLWRVLITHKLERIFFCLVLALESQAFFSNLSPPGFAQNEQLWLLHHLHCCHSIFNLSLEASPMQRSCRSSGPVQNVEWQ